MKHNSRDVNAPKRFVICVIKKSEIMKKFTKYLLVLYTKEVPSQGFIQEQLDLIGQNYLFYSRGNMTLKSNKFGQVSYLKLNLPEVTINSSGYIQEPLAVTTYGYWSWERIAESLPYEYQLK